MKDYTILLIIMGVILCGLILVGSFGCQQAQPDYNNYELVYKGRWGAVQYYYDTVHNVGIWFSESGGIAVLPADNISNPQALISEKPLITK